MEKKNETKEVVRCKECKFWGNEVYGFRCRRSEYPLYTTENDYCSRAEREDKEL